ncbi:hypothetical protein MASR2M48_16340 [Spirochaetota bacterium]
MMIDTNIFDRLDADPELACELENRRDMRLFVSDIQLKEIAAIHEDVRRERYLDLVRRLCVKVSAALPSTQPETVYEDRHDPDRLIAAASKARCELLVSDDLGLLDYAARNSLRVMDWRHFCSLQVYRC